MKVGKSTEENRKQGARTSLYRHAWRQAEMLISDQAASPAIRARMDIQDPNVQRKHETSEVGDSRDDDHGLEEEIEHAKSSFIDHHRVQIHSKKALSRGMTKPKNKA
ncbi:hypothetical protein G7K_4318-t1 [Saitoella complicata NRRL Y-17804]|uniref:Uncharacterized protein n=1 Tax=Saitoella complicata (strain BCRC 22490 / CBS 7301 / JCM 7358 / NBRC 10748 / NRRL Y-17804) TaxID=698492 RepID=A0A0E9NK16_SAICN|nr:hypothetical protein G7K_4318-t1 [Saitoella complicata NRRL Y-17804]